MLTAAEVKKFIDEDISSEKKRFAKVGDDYYEGKHDILKSKLYYFNKDGKLVEDTTRENIKIPHPFFTEITDQLTYYMLSSEENPIRSDVEGLQEHLDLYFNDAFWYEIGELITGAYTKGFEYIYGFKGAENRMKFQCADSMGVVEVRAKETDDNCDYIIYWYIDRIGKNKKAIKRIQVWSETETTYYMQVNNGKVELDDTVEINPRPHIVYTDGKTGQKMGYPLGFIPFWRLDNNKKQISALKPIKAIIDDYDRMQCGLSNNLKDFDIPLYVVKGFEGDDLEELAQNLRTKKVVGTSEDGDIEVRTVDIPYQARQAKASDDKTAIYSLSMSLNLEHLRDTSATTNTGIKAAYFNLELKAKKMENRLKPLLNDILEVVLAEINKNNGTGYKITDVYIKFKRTTITNEQENITNEKTKADTMQVNVTTILNAAQAIGAEQTIKLLCDAFDLDYDEVKKQLDAEAKANDLATAKATLNNIVPDDEGGDV